MGIFNDDPIDSIFEEFFGPGRRGNRRRQFITGEEEERTADFIESKKHVYLIFELPGFNEKDVVVIVNKGILEIKVQKQNGETMQSYLSQKLKRGSTIQKELPAFINAKKFSHTMKNGILEIVFERKK